MIHCVNVFAENDQGRHARARKSWEDLPFKRAYIEQKEKPQWKDIINRGFASYPEEDLLIFTNADSVLAMDTYEIIDTYYRDATHPVTYSHRGNFYKQLNHPLKSERIESLMVMDTIKLEDQVIRPNRNGILSWVFKGVDLVVFPRWWWERQQKSIPDFRIGYQGWDYWVRALSLIGEAKDCGSVLVAHEMHNQPSWFRYAKSIENIRNWQALHLWADSIGFNCRDDWEHFNHLKFYVYGYFEMDIPFYIGKGSDRRAWTHLVNCNSQSSDFYDKLSSIPAAERKDCMRILSFCLTASEAHLEEQRLISYYGRKDQGFGPLLNKTDGNRHYDYDIMS